MAARGRAVRTDDRRGRPARQPCRPRTCTRPAPSGGADACTGLRRVDRYHRQAGRHRLQPHIYTDGYRYKGRPLGHWADGDSNIWTVGGLLRDLAGGQALAVLRYGTLNRLRRQPDLADRRGSVTASLQWRTVIDRDFGLDLRTRPFRTCRQIAAGPHDSRTGATPSCACSSTGGCTECGRAAPRRASGAECTSDAWRAIFGGRLLATRAAADARLAGLVAGVRRRTGAACIDERRLQSPLALGAGHRQPWPMP